MKGIRGAVSLVVPIAFIVVAASCLAGVTGPQCALTECEIGQCCLEGCGGVDPVDTCAGQPIECPTTYDPVCGCDGNTYPNACQAHALCVAISFAGRCEVQTCDGQVCDTSQCCLRGCGGVEPAIACTTPPDACAEIFSPVCGCDGVTYANACEAHAACVAVANDNPCDAPVCGVTTCSEGQCCLHSCGGVDQAVACVTPPATCSPDPDQVCGCDSNTYANACEAHAACIAIDHIGPC